MEDRVVEQDAERDVVGDDGVPQACGTRAGRSAGSTTQRTTDLSALHAD